MARLPYLNKADLPPADQDLLSRPINLARLMAHSPNAARSFYGIGKWIRFDSKLDTRLRELAILAVGYLCRAPYEYSHHAKIGQDFGVTPNDIESLARYLDGEGSGELNALDRCIIDAAREITATEKIEDATYANLEKALTAELLVDLIMTISFYNCVVRFLGAFEIDVEPEYQPYLEQFPLPEP